MDNSNLVKLITSLKKSEKRYFVLYLLRNKENNKLLKLFKIISDNPSITDAEIPERIKDKSIISRLHQNKYVLYQLLLDVLHQQDLNKSPYARILTMLHQSEILLNKGLTQARMELLLKAGQLADEYELLELKLEIVRLRNAGRADPDFLKETQQLTNKIIDHAELKHLTTRLVIFQNKSGDRLTLTQKKYSSKLFSTFKKKSVKQDSFYSKYVYFTFLMIHYRVLGQFNEVNINGMMILKLFKQYPNMLRIQLWRFLYCYRIHELLPAWFRVSENKMAELAYNEILNIEIATVYKNAARVNILDHYLQTGEFRKGESFLNNIETHLPINLHGNDRLILYSNLAMMNFGLGIYSKALFWLNELLNSSTKQLIDFPYTGIIRLIRLITYYELKKTDVLENEIHSTSNYIVKHEKKFKMDQLIMEYLKKMISINDKAELRKVMEEARNKLLKLTKIKTEARILEAFDFVSWFESKIENRSFEAVVKEKAKRELRIV